MILNYVEEVDSLVDEFIDLRTASELSIIAAVTLRNAGGEGKAMGDSV
jgi:hypothetical protein